METFKITPVISLILFVACSSAPKDTSSINIKQEPRLKQLTIEDLTKEQKAAYDKSIAKNFSRAGLGGPFNLLIRSPELTNTILPLYDYYNGPKNLSIQQIRLMTVTVARYWDSKFVWSVHKKFAIRDGLDPEALQQIQKGDVPTKLKEDERLIYEFCAEMLKSHQVSDKTFGELKAKFTEAQIADMAALLPTATSISLMTNFLEVLPKEVDELPKLKNPLPYLK
jgi:4-carboxymuconolactone decarboxylase